MPSPHARLRAEQRGAAVVVRGIPAGFAADDIVRICAAHGEVICTRSWEVAHRSGRVEGFVEVGFADAGTASRAAAEVNGMRVTDTLPAPRTMFVKEAKKAAPSTPMQALELAPHPHLVVTPTCAPVVSLAAIMAEEQQAGSQQTISTAAPAMALPQPKHAGQEQRPRPSSTLNLGLSGGAVTLQANAPRLQDVRKADKGKKARKRRGAREVSSMAELVCSGKEALSVVKAQHAVRAAVGCATAFEALARSTSAEAA